jgi:hypothetical protein
MVKRLDQNDIIFYTTIDYDHFLKIETPKFRAKIGSEIYLFGGICRNTPHEVITQLCQHPLWDVTGFDEPSVLAALRVGQIKVEVWAVCVG